MRWFWRLTASGAPGSEERQGGRASDAAYWVFSLTADFVGKGVLERLATIGGGGFTGPPFWTLRGGGL